MPHKIPPISQETTPKVKLNFSPDLPLNRLNALRTWVQGVVSDKSRHAELTTSVLLREAVKVIDNLPEAKANNPEIRILDLDSDEPQAVSNTEPKIISQEEIQRRERVLTWAQSINMPASTYEDVIKLSTEFFYEKVEDVLLARCNKKGIVFRNIGDFYDLVHDTAINALPRLLQRFDPKVSSFETYLTQRIDGICRDYIRSSDGNRCVHRAAKKIEASGKSSDLKLPTEIMAEYNVSFDFAVRVTNFMAGTPNLVYSEDLDSRPSVASLNDIDQSEATVFNIESLKTADELTQDLKLKEKIVFILHYCLDLKQREISYVLLGHEGNSMVSSYLTRIANKTGIKPKSRAA